MKSKDIDFFSWLNQAVNNKELTTCNWEHDHRFKDVWITSRPRTGPGIIYGYHLGHPFHCKCHGCVKNTDDWISYKSIEYALKRSLSNDGKPGIIIPCAICFKAFYNEFFNRLDLK